jgi:hypothetical protein
MVPKGAAHIPMRGTVRICKKLEIDYAEAVTGFEFGKRMAIPVITGVVVAEENEKAVREAWKAWDEEQRKKEEGKLEKAVLALWRKFVMGLRINERVQEAYGDEVDTHAHLRTTPTADEGDTANLHAPGDGPEMGGGFFLPHEDESHAGDLIMEHYEPIAQEKKQTEGAQYPTPMSLPSSKQKGTPKSLLQVMSDTSELSDISAGSDGVDSLAGDSDTEAGEPDGGFAPKRRARTRQAKSHQRPITKAPAAAGRAQRKRGRNAMTSQYFQATDDDTEL